MTVKGNLANFTRRSENLTSTGNRPPIRECILGRSGRVFLLKSIYREKHASSKSTPLGWTLPKQSGPRIGRWSASRLRLSPNGTLVKRGPAYWGKGKLGILMTQQPILIRTASYGGTNLVINREEPRRKENLQERPVNGSGKLGCRSINKFQERRGGDRIDRQGLGKASRNPGLDG